MNKKFSKYWKKAANAKTTTAIDMAFLCALKAFFAKPSNSVTREEIFHSLFGSAFTPVTNKTKLKNGVGPFDAQKVALRDASYWRWKGNGPIDLTDTSYKIFVGLSEIEVFANIFEGDYVKFRDFWAFLTNMSISITCTRDSVLSKTLSHRYYVYIFVNQNEVSPIQQLVQAAHVAMVIGQKMDKDLDARNVYYQVCELPHTTQYLDAGLEDFSNHLSSLGFKNERFFEPDMNRTVALATYPVRSDKRKSLLKYKLLEL